MIVLLVQKSNITVRISPNVSGWANSSTYNELLLPVPHKLKREIRKLNVK